MFFEREREEMAICCFTGHRELGEHAQWLQDRLKLQVELCIGGGIKEFRCGGALGFDTLAAEAVLEMKKKYDDVRLVMMIPCRDQDKGWSAENRRRYQQILKQADQVNVLSEHYYRGCMFVRNRALVDGSELCIAYLRHSRGGTAMTVAYAEKKQVTVINLGDLI